ncbi:ANTAR domain-containing protein [Geodermatophilus sp. SYSU D00965]
MARCSPRGRTPDPEALFATTLALRRRARAIVARAVQAASEAERLRDRRTPGTELRRLRAELSAVEARARHLEVALGSNRRIGMALGILMARHGITEERAFAALQRVSCRRNVKLREVAEEVVHTGATPRGCGLSRASAASS